FEVVQVGVAALGRHRALAVQGYLQHRVEAGADVFGPGSVVADLRRAGHAGGVTGRADRLEDGFARLEHARGVGIAQLETGHRLDARRDGFGRLRVGAGVGL